jgi:putative transposase
MEKFRNKYRIPSARWQNWDYGSNAAYYVTICTRYHKCDFGKIVLSPKKSMQYSELGSMAYQYWTEIPSHFPFVDLDAFVIMPNHIHGIVVINKTGVKKCATMHHIDFTWQPRFHDHVIRNYNEYIAIRNYILHNIENWKEDSPLHDDD